MKLLNVFTLTLRVVCFENRRDKKRGGGGVPAILSHFYETAMIKAYDSLAPRGYSQTSGGEGNKEVSEETRTTLKRIFIISEGESLK